MFAKYESLPADAPLQTTPTMTKLKYLGIHFRILDICVNIIIKVTMSTQYYRYILIYDGNIKTHLHSSSFSAVNYHAFNY